MAEEKATKKTTKKAAKEETKARGIKDWEGKNVSELRVELQKILIDIRTGKERNTSLIKKLKRTIANLKTRESLDIKQK